MTAVPERTLRHFPDGGLDLSRPGARSQAIERLLEDGDRADLAWLVAAVGRQAIAGWLLAAGPRRLSRRSRSFWFTVLDCGAAPRPPAAEALWPLA